MALELFTLAAKLKLESGEFVQGMKDAVQEAGGLKKVMTSVTGTIINGINKLTDYADKVDKGSKSLRISAKTYQELSYAMGLSGANIESLSRGISNLTDAALGKGTKDVADALSQLGLSPEALASMGSADVRLKTVLKTIADIQDETQRANIAETLFGRGAGQSLAAFLADGSKGIEDLINEANNLGLVMSNESINAGVQAKDSMDKLNQVLNQLLLEVLTPLLPPIKQIVDAFMPLIEQLVPIVKLVAKGIESVLTPILKLAGYDPERYKKEEAQKEEARELFKEIADLEAQGYGIEKRKWKNGSERSSELEEEAVKKYGAAGYAYVSKYLAATGRSQYSYKSDQNLSEEELLLQTGAYIDSVKEKEAAEAKAKQATDFLTGAATNATKSVSGLDSAAQNAASALNNVSSPVDDEMSGHPTGRGHGGSFAKGDWNVPYDNYPALLHRGEMVLTSSNARRYREGGGVDIGAIAAAVSDAIRAAMGGLNLRAYVVDRDVTDAVNRRIGNDLKARRFAT